MERMPYVWWNGELRPAAEALLPLGTHALHYGTGVFEGIRAYEQSDGETVVVRLGDHMRRLATSAGIYRMSVGYDLDALCDAVWELLEANEMSAGYIRPIVWRGNGELGLNPQNAPVEVAMMAWPWGAYLGSEALEQGIRVTVSSVRRFDANVLPSRAKATGQYLNGALAKTMALEAGFDEAILLDHKGSVSEGTGENIFLVRDGALLTPTVADSILEGITRDTVLHIARDLGMRVVERSIARDELLIADEVFFTGTAAEITPICEIDGTQLGTRGPVTKRLQDAFFGTIAGRERRWSWMLDHDTRDRQHRMGLTG